MKLSSKSVNLTLIAVILISGMFPVLMSIGSLWIPSASGYTSRTNDTNTQHNWSGGAGAPTTECTTTCDNSGSSIAYFNFTFFDGNNAVGNENDVEGAGIPMNHTVWVHVNDTANTQWYRNFTGDAGQSQNGVFTVTREELSTIGKVNVSFEWTIQSGFESGVHSVNFNVTDNATTFTSNEIWDNSTSFTVAAATESINEQLLDPTGVDQNIVTGYWGNITTSPGATNVEWLANYLRIENDGAFPTQQFTVDFSTNDWDSAKSGDSITTDANIEWAWANTNFSSDNPGNSFTSEGASWSAWLSDTTGSREFRFYALGEFSWVKIRILAIPDPLGMADDFVNDYTITTSGTA